jgi:phosphatidylserine/phosphatidylglycerophosphate/cardiolipin synthase-like enzyme
MKASPRVLYTSSEVRSAIVELFEDPHAERIAISAFVGDGARAYLPHPAGIRLLCSPTPGATNPSELRYLLGKGVRVDFVDSLHMKIYWAKKRGAIITSANLSTNAMGTGGLKEAGVLLPADEIDIKRVLRHLKWRPAKPNLRLLDRKHREYYKHVGWIGQKRSVPSYVEWFDSPEREQWRIFLYSTRSYDLSKAIMQKVRQEFDTKPYEWIWSTSPNVRENDWILCGFTSAGRLGRPYWLFADRVFAVPKSDANYDREFPYEVIQIHSTKHYPPPPFSVTDKFRRSLTRVLDARIVDRGPKSPQDLGAQKLSSIYRSMS